VGYQIGEESDEHRRASAKLRGKDPESFLPPASLAIPAKTSSACTLSASAWTQSRLDPSAHIMYLEHASYTHAIDWRRERGCTSSRLRTAIQAGVYIGEQSSAVVADASVDHTAVQSGHLLG